MSKLVNLSGLKTLLEPIVHLINKKAERPDWNENDPNSPDYIENKPFGTEVTETKIYDEFSFSIKADESIQIEAGLYFAYACADDSSKLPPLPNASIPVNPIYADNQYTIIFDGVENQVIAQSYGDGTIIGNPNLYDDSLEDNGLPYVYLYMASNATGIFAVSNLIDSDVSISTVTTNINTVIHKIDEKYLPAGAGIGAKGEAEGAEVFNDYEYNLASGDFSHAEGEETIASGYSSHVEGWGSTAQGDCSHAEGCSTGALGIGSHSEGGYNRALGDYQHVQGKFNIFDTTSAHIVGNGTDAHESNRSNAHTLDWNGNAWFAGDVYTGSTSGTNKDDGSKKLATEEYVDTIHNTSETAHNDIRTAVSNISALVGDESVASQIDKALKSSNIYIYPEDYGAVGDGITDDSAAIQAAINASIEQATSTGWDYELKPVVYLASKTYRINTGLVFDSRCLQFKCDGIIDYSGTDCAIIVKHSQMNIYINVIKATNGTGIRLTGAEHMCVANNIDINRINSSTVGVSLYNYGTSAQGMYYNRINIGPIIATQTCVDLYAENGYINENLFWLGRLSHATIGIKIKSNKANADTGAGTNRFFSGAFEDLAENACSLWLEDTVANLLKDFRCEENYGLHNIKFVGECDKNDIWLSSTQLGGVDISELAANSRMNVIRGTVLTGTIDGGGYYAGTLVNITGESGITYDPHFANISKRVTSTSYIDNILGQTSSGMETEEATEDTEVLIPTTFIFDTEDINGSTFTIGALYSEDTSLARGFPVVYRFGSEHGKIILMDSRGKKVLDNSDGKYLNRRLLIQWIGMDRYTSENIWDITDLDDFSALSIDTTDAEVGVRPSWIAASYTNLVPSAIDTDGNVLNGVGYAEGYRISSDGTIKEQSSTILTGFMPCTGINDSTIIRMKGAQFDSSVYSGIALYDSNFNLMNAVRFPSATSINENISGLILYVTTGTVAVLGDNGITTITLNFNESILANNPPAYMRIFAVGTGSNLVITMDEELD